MPRFKKKEPEYTAVRFDGLNGAEVVAELGPGWETPHTREGFEYEMIQLYRGGVLPVTVRRGEWVVKDPYDDSVETWSNTMFKRSFESARGPGRPRNAG